MKNIKLFIVEDEILVAREIEGYLCKLGYHVTGIAASAEGALKQIAEEPPDLVLVDIVLKGEQNGITLAQQLRDRFQIPVVYLTAYVDPATLEQAKRTCPFGYILKPFNQNDLRATIEIALARYQAEQEEKNLLTESIDAQSFQYLSILSHELRNPLSAIQVSTTMLGDDRYPLDDAKKQQLLQRIHSSTDSINQLIEDVLMVGQTNRDTNLFNPENTDIVEFCQMLLESLQWNLGEHCQCSIAFSHNSEQIHACVDKKLLWHLLNNLLSNAIKYSPDNTPILFRLYRTGQDIHFEIQDQGIGILPEDLQDLFQPFRRGSNVGKLPGTGLGLAIAKRAAELHNGEIAVQSQVSHGTTFTVKLPLSVQGI